MQTLWLHYGDADHLPMQTVRFTGTARDLRAIKKEARIEGCPLRIARVG